MPYTKTVWQDNVTLGNQTNMNNLESQYSEATNSFEQDLFTPFVLSGLIASADATTATQLDVTAGIAFPLQSDGTLRRRSLGSSTQTTSVANTTYYLDLNPDGTWSWGTAHSAQANYLAIAQVTTNGSGQISTVTDKRATTPSLLPGKLGGSVTPPPLASVPLDAPQPGPYAGTIIGAVTTGAAGAIAGSADGAMTFPGSDSAYINVPTAGFPTGVPGSGFSIECWVKVVAFPGSYCMPLVVGSNSAGGEEMHIQINSTGTIQAGNSTVNTPASSPVALNTWHHVAAIWDGTNLKCYMDGTLTGSVAASLNFNNFAGGGAYIGRFLNTGAAYNGSIDEVAFYNGTLTPTQISTHYSVGRNGSATTTYAKTVLGDSPLRYYRLGDTSGRGVALQAVAASSSVVSQDGGISPSYVGAVAGQPTVGPLGVPVIVAQALNVHVTSTAGVNIVVFLVPADGFYRANLAFSWSNSANSALQANVLWTDPNAGSIGVYFTANGVYLSGSTTLIAGTVAQSAAPLTVYAKAGTYVQVQFRDPSGVPNDYVSAVIERLS